MPKDINISMFDIRHSAAPACTSTLIFSKLHAEGATTTAHNYAVKDIIHNITLHLLQQCRALQNLHIDPNTL